MDLLAIIGLVVTIYYLIYMIYPWFLDCDLKLAFYEKFGKPISSLKGKTVWITGASSGIGESFAYVLADAGCKLILSARRKELLKKVKANCLQRNSNLNETDVEVLVLDICDIDNHKSAFERVIEKFGKLDILVNNAGRSQRAVWEDIDLSVDKNMFSLNVFSQIALSRLVAKYFFQVGTGHFVVTSSAAGITSVAYSATYCGTKYALHGYFNSFWIEKVGSNIPITMVCPGPIQTNFLEEAFTEKPGEKYGERTKESPQNKVSAERCATLMGIAVANQLLEVWISKPIVLQLMYLKIYYPNIAIWIFKLLGPRFLQGLRDDKATIKQEQ
ncbi:dehydrogenase/reductase SDR family member 7 [Halictus rubicundus]|uniref:dehydrogenase/reductase SDR family member 7 n=1 Tax=Halictus rubicundus TaxID=77578 RepID=UPI004035709F